MDRVFFEEKQTYPRTLVWIVILAGFAACLPLVYGFYVRTQLHQPWGDPSLDDSELLVLAFISMVVGGVAASQLAIARLETRIDSDAMYYRLAPYYRKIRKIEKSAIMDYEIRKLGWLEKTRGRRTGRFGRRRGTEIFSITGDMAVELTLAGGHKLLLGTNNPEGLRWAMKKLMTNS